MKQVRLEDIIHMLKEIQPLEKFEENTLLFESGYIDSMTIFNELLPKLEEFYGIEVEPLDLIPEHFETPGAIQKYVTGKGRDK